MKKNIGMRFTDEELKELDNLANRMGQSRSGMCAYFVKTLMNIAKTRGVLELQHLLFDEGEK